ncbi:MAG: hypothetical protein OXH68_04350 [Gammaproteobacteria bacterium]|nr:hypothetical protein [Gammaproteobacteria bacterium]
MSAKKLAAVTTLVLLPMWGNAQEQRTEPVSVDTDRGPLVALPRLDTMIAGSVVVDDVRFEISVEGGFRVCRAHQESQTRTLYEAVDGRPGRYAYDPVKRRFERVSATLRVRLADAERLDEVVASTGALRGKNYPALGWALLRLRPEQDPAAVARSLLDGPLVVSAELIVEGPIRVPQ